MRFSRRTGGRRRTGGKRRMGGRRRTGGMGIVNQAAAPAFLYGLQKHVQHRNKKRRGGSGGVKGMLSTVRKAFGGARTRRFGGRRRGGTRRR